MYRVNSAKPLNNKDNKQKKCLRCGSCCRGGVLSFIDIKETRKWKKHNRQDIIGIMNELSPVWAGDHYFSAITGKRINGCPFIKHDGDLYSCSIYDLRPDVCARFKPGSSMICPQYDLSV